MKSTTLHLEMGRPRAAAGDAALQLHKYPIARDRHIAAVFAADIEPMEARVIDATVGKLPPLE